MTKMTKAEMRAWLAFQSGKFVPLAPKKYTYDNSAFWQELFELMSELVERLPPDDAEDLTTPET